MNNIMVDLETLGTRPGSIVLSIGAVYFDEGGLGPSFYEEIDQASSEDVGLRKDASTVKWWSEQNDTARQVLLRTADPDSPHTKSLRSALTAFGGWLSVDAVIWGNGASFDNALLAECYAMCGIALPWKFWNDRCYRTLKNIAPHIPFERSGTHHNALDDAISQAKHASVILKWLGRP